MNNVARLRQACCCIGLAAVFGSAACRADGNSAPPAGVADISAVWEAASDAQLAGMRGGFDPGTGLVISFGIERVVCVNGALVTTNGFHIGSLGAVTAKGAPPMAAQDMPASQQAGALSAIQNGTANLIRTDAARGALPAFVIQNTLNDQTIRTITTVNAVSNSLNLLKSANLVTTLGQAIGAAAGSR